MVKTEQAKTHLIVRRGDYKTYLKTNITPGHGWVEDIALASRFTHREASYHLKMFNNPNLYLTKIEKGE